MTRARVAVRPRVALIGDPVAQSISPAMHAAAFADLNLPWEYHALSVPIRRLPSVLPELARSFVGLNVTRPLKTAILPLLDRVSAVAALAGSVNTVVFRDGVSEGASTDGAGFLAALDAGAANTPRHALVVGSGGAARAVASALQGCGTEVAIAGRNQVATVSLAGDLGAVAVRFEERELQHAVDRADVLVNATPAGSLPFHWELPIPRVVNLHRELVVFDLVYRPRRTALLRLASTSGCSTIEGVEMLIEQGARSIELWTGLPAPVETMRRAAYRALADDRAETPAARSGTGRP